MLWWLSPRNGRDAALRDAVTIKCKRGKLLKIKVGYIGFRVYQLRGVC